MLLESLICMQTLLVIADFKVNLVYIDSFQAFVTVAWKSLKTVGAF